MRLGFAIDVDLAVDDQQAVTRNGNTPFNIIVPPVDGSDHDMGHVQNPFPWALAKILIPCFFRPAGRNIFHLLLHGRLPDNAVDTCGGIFQGHRIAGGKVEHDDIIAFDMPEPFQPAVVQLDPFEIGFMCSGSGSGQMERIGE